MADRRHLTVAWNDHAAKWSGLGSGSERRGFILTVPRNQSATWLGHVLSEGASIGAYMDVG